MNEIGSTPGQQHRQHRERDDRCPPVAAHQGRAHDPQAGQHQHHRRHLEHDAHRQQRQQHELDVVLRAQLVVEGLVVVADQEADRGRHHQEPGEHDADDEQRGDHQRQRAQRAVMLLRDGRDQEGVQLVGRDRHGQQQPGVDRDRDRGEDAVQRAGGQELVGVPVGPGKRRRHRVQDRPRLPEAGADRDGEDRQHHDQAAAQLVEVVDQRQPVAGMNAGAAQHRASSGGCFRPAGSGPAAEDGRRR